MGKLNSSHTVEKSASDVEGSCNDDGFMFLLQVRLGGYSVLVLNLGLQRRGDGWKIYYSQAGQLKMQQTFLKALK